MWRLAIIVLLTLLLFWAGPALKERSKSFLENPNNALAAVVVGLLLVYVEFCFPGTVVPASLGGALILLALSGMANQACNWWAVSIIGLGLFLLFVEARFQLYGVAGFGAAVLLVWGTYTFIPGLRLVFVASWLTPWVVITTLLLRFAWLARQNKMVSFCFGR